MSIPRDAKRPQKVFADIAPEVAQLGGDVLWGGAWQRPRLNRRDRNVITRAALVAAGLA
jgi:alkylhydroperoxidase/carboxymuconolactone decarboxylase family protein YurZ